MIDFFEDSDSYVWLQSLETSFRLNAIGYQSSFNWSFPFQAHYHKNLSVSDEPNATIKLRRKKKLENLEIQLFLFPFTRQLVVNWLKTHSYPSPAKRSSAGRHWVNVSKMR